ncbi:MAG: hypothetical protein J6N21_22355, partial [Butyrivibrio sp.]|nr:hypothetical protein [Butyrivibrio sp.]
MMKGIIERIQPSCFDDLGVINAIGRPGPISIGLDKKYADVKNGKEAISYPIRGCEDILDETFGNPVYQEQLMFISKKISGFDDMQADSITRKVLGKKKVAMFPMMKRCHVFGKKNCEGPEGWENDDNAPWYDPKGKYGKEIPGALVNGYTKEEVLSYFDQIEGFAKYCFNRAHSACYAYIGFLTAWLKTHYPTQFMAAVLSMAADEKKPLYVEASEKMGIKIAVPDINISGADFTPDAKNNRILYGIGAVKGVGEKAVPEILAAQPFTSLEDAIERIPKKAFNKKIAENLIQAGAFDSINTNRYTMLNELHRLRKDKGTEECPEDKFDSETIIFMEEETLGAPITYKPWWKTIKENEKIDAVGRIVSVGERFDKTGRPMAFPQVEINNCKISGIMFASKYVKHAIMINDYSDNLDYAFEFLGKKDEKGTLIINDIKLIKLEDAA